MYAAGGSDAKVLRFDDPAKPATVFQSGELSAQAIVFDCTTISTSAPRRTEKSIKSLPTACNPLSSIQKRNTFGHWQSTRKAICSSARATKAKFSLSLPTAGQTLLSERRAPRPFTCIRRQRQLPGRHRSRRPNSSHRHYSQGRIGAAGSWRVVRHLLKRTKKK